ncbi:hypothetical protein D0Y65_051796 [Glycine soja]|nr:hypothetical protein D0Y65_051796 [Glycine soja]RZB48450.1 hypothetical protein D0Y65_051796 [Glycine soja]RZB48451.1 hypothetical protein D0Y65_051796 [Glycine soja]
MEGHNGLNTLECLRGRLLAERHASRVAKEEAESLGNKFLLALFWDFISPSLTLKKKSWVVQQFVELEKKLKEEIKLRDKAERKLKLLKKKLECFNNVTTPSWQKYHSSEKCEDSCGSSLSSAVSRDSEANETKLVHTVNPALLENEVHNHNVAEECVLVQTQNSPFTTKDCNSDPSNFLPQILGNNPNQSSDNLKNDGNRLSLSSSKSLAEGYNSQGTDDCSSNPSPTEAFPENICHNSNPIPS